MYIKPEVKILDSLNEGVYAASGSVENLECDSIFMKGQYQAPNYQGWKTYKEQFGCLGCPAFTENGCGLTSHYEDAEKAKSYDIDKGKRKPSWETKGYFPNDIVLDWDV